MNKQNKTKTMDELEIINQKGIAKSSEIAKITGKSLRNTIAKLNRLEKAKEIEIINFHRGKLYVAKGVRVAFRKPKR